MRYLLYPISIIYGFVVEVRHFLFLIRILKSKKIEAKVISVGNLSMGGTGKTPIVATLLKYCAEHNISAGVVTRGYGSGIGEVTELTEPDAEKFGDEPSWLKQRFPNVPIFISPNRVQAAQKLVECYKPQVIIADDAFQHRYLKRDLNLLVLDTTEPKKNYHLLPVGRLRESFCHTKRADYVFLSKINLASAEQLQWLNQKVKGKKMEWEYSPKSLLSSDGDIIPLDFIENKSVFLVSGIGRPETFENVVKYQSHCINGHLKYVDHHNYTQLDVDEIKRQAHAAIIVTTEKDLIKLKEFELSALALQMEAKPKEPLDVFFN